MKTNSPFSPLAVTATSFALLCLLTFAQSLFSREFTSTDGKKMEASVIAVQGTSVVLKRGAKQYTVPVNRFSLDDQSYIKKWAEDKMQNMIPKLKVDINPGKSNRSDRKDYYDDRKGSFQVSINISNEEIHYILNGGKASLSVIGEDCYDTKKYGIMQKSSFKVDIQPGKNFTWKGSRLHFKFDDSPPAYWGVKYYGFVFQIKNANGKVIHKSSSQKKFVAYIDKILKLNVEAGFDKGLNSRNDIHIYKN